MGLHATLKMTGMRADEQRELCLRISHVSELSDDLCALPCLPYHAVFVVQVDTTNILFICGGAFVGLDEQVANRHHHLLHWLWQSCQVGSIAGLCSLRMPVHSAASPTRCLHWLHDAR